MHLSLLAIHLLTRVRNQANVDVLWIKAHAGLWGNEMADRAAKAGATPANERLVWTRNLMVTDWGENEFVSMLMTFSEKGHLVENRLQQDYPEMTNDFRRVRRDGRSLPSLQSISKAVAEVASHCGHAHQSRAVRVPDDDQDMLDLKHFEELRRNETCGVIRHWYSAQVSKCRRKVRRKLANLRCQQAAESGRRLLKRHGRQNC